MNDEQMATGLALLERFVTAYETDTSMRHAEALARVERAAKSDALIEMIVPHVEKMIAQAFGGPVGVPNAAPADVVPLHADAADPDTSVETPAAKAATSPPKAHGHESIFAGQNLPE